ncbi:MAG: hypothetical protein IJK02_08105 [Clostridia bacterium]|nr:hypothetical protein [Clostridia bacterium]
MMKRNRNIDFNRDTYDESRRILKRILWCVLAAVLVGGASFVILLARNDFDFSRFIGRRTETTTDETTSETETAGGGSAPLFSDENAVNILFLCADEEKLDFCEIFSFSKAECSIKIKAIAPDLPLTYNGKKDALSGIYKSYSGSAVRDAIVGRGIPIARMITAQESGFRQVIRLLGPVTVDVPREADFSVDGIRYTLEAKPQEMTADTLLNYMTHAFSDDERVSIQAGAWADILRQHLTPENVERGESFFSKLINCVNTDISAFDYAEYRMPLSDFLMQKPGISVIN